MLDMKANDTSIRVFLEGSKQFIVPLFQRTYSWRKKNIKKMWGDLIATLENGDQSHFFGSFVTMPVPTSASSVSKYTIVDGQQRLTTTALVLAAIRNRLFELEPEYKNKDEINELYLINKFTTEEKYRIVPTETDRVIFFSIVDGVVKVPNGHRLAEAFATIRKELDQIGSVPQLEQLKSNLLSKFSVVDIRLESGDDPYLIFESLNATGTPLTQADLIRNYLFMGISNENQLSIYKDLWLPLQSKLDNNLEAFFRHYLAIDGKIPNIQRIYSTFRDVTMNILSDESSREMKIIQLMENLKTHSGHYYKLLHPQNEDDALVKEYLGKIKKLRLTTSYPLLLSLYDSYNQGKIDAAEFSNCLKLVEAFVVRRAVCGVPTNVLNRYFPTVFHSLNSDDLVNSLRKKLIAETGSHRMPKDDEFGRCITERKLYGNRILSYILRAIEKHDNKEIVTFKDLQIEHIMPRTLTNEWKKALGENWELTYSEYLDTLGNLTLTGYNREYSNRSFTEKRDMDKGFRNSGLRINRSLAKLDKWGKEEIEKRAHELADIALKIW